MTADANPRIDSYAWPDKGLVQALLEFCSMKVSTCRHPPLLYFKARLGSGHVVQVTSGYVFGTTPILGAPTVEGCDTAQPTSSATPDGTTVSVPPAPPPPHQTTGDGTTL